MTFTPFVPNSYLREYERTHPPRRIIRVTPVVEAPVNDTPRSLSKRIRSAASRLKKRVQRLWRPRESEPDKPDPSRYYMIVQLNPVTRGSLMEVDRDGHAILPKTWLRQGTQFIRLQLYAQVRVMQLAIKKFMEKRSCDPVHETIVWWATRLNLAGVTVDEFDKLCSAYNYILELWPKETANFPRLASSHFETERVPGMLIIWLFWILKLATCYEDKYLTQLVYKFIYNHELLCGDPFFEADWLPAMGECIIDCEPTQYICLVNTEGNETQKCRELSRNCTMAIRKQLGWTTTWFRSNATTTSTTTTSTQEPDAFVTSPEPEELDAFVTSPEPKEQLLGLVPPQSSTPGGFPETNKIFRDPSRQMTYKLKKLEPSPNSINEFIGSNEVSKPSFIVGPPSSYGDESEDVKITDQYYSPVKSILNYIPVNSNSVEATTEVSRRPRVRIQPKPLESLDNFITARQSFEKIEAEQNMAARLAYGNSNEQGAMMPAFRPPKNDDLPATGTRVEIVPPLPPLDPPPPPRKLKKPKMLPIPPVPIDTTKILLPLPSIELPQIEEDASIQCCSWALNGLCDRSWRKIRELCPKSCGTILCEFIEGVKSCTRMIDVDVEECYQKIRFAKTHGVRTMPIDDKKALIEDLMLEQIASKHRKSSRKNKSKRLKKKRAHKRII